MHSNKYVLSNNTIKMVSNEAIKKHFKSVSYEELCQQNSSDRSYYKYFAEGILAKYSALDTTELAHLIEYSAISLLEEILWGHRFEANVIVQSKETSDFCTIYVSLSVLREE